MVGCDCNYAILQIKGARIIVVRAAELDQAPQVKLQLFASNFKVRTHMHTKAFSDSLNVTISTGTYIVDGSK